MLFIGIKNIFIETFLWNFTSKIRDKNKLQYPSDILYTNFYADHHKMFHFKCTLDAFLHYFI